MIPTLNQVFDAARAHLGDIGEDVPGGEIFTNTYFRDHNLLRLAFSELYEQMAMNSIPRGARRAHYNLPADTSYLAPSTAGISNYGEPESHNAVMERAVRNTGSVTGAVINAGSVDLTVTAHPFTAGQSVIVYGILGLSDDVNDEWTISKPNANTVRLNGCVATGTYTSGGTVSDSGEDWATVNPVTEIQAYPAAPETVLGKYAWTGDVFRFIPASIQRQLKLSYYLSGEPPSADTSLTGVDDSLSFLSHRIASLAASNQGAMNRSKDLDERASFSLARLIRLQVRSLPSVSMPRFRPHRNMGPSMAF